MCGICGFSWENKKLIKNMMNSIAHRGPDQNNYFIDKNISLGHQRLSIVDLTESGKQPMYNEDKSMWIIYNGEIYNYLEIKQNLEKKGHRFYSNTDTEVILHAYEEYGTSCLEQFNGFFAFAIHDSINKQIFLARDRIGIKPLYYTIINNQLMFASEIKAILENKQIKRQVNENALYSFLTFRCNTLFETMFKDIFKIPPAHYIIFKNKEPIIKKYWQLNIKETNKSKNYFSKKLKQNLIKSIKYRLMGEVPLGVYFSGGIDSATIVGLLHEFSNVPIKTFSVDFETLKQNKEIDNANYLASKFNTDHHVLKIKPDTINLLSKIVYHLDEPMSDPTSIPTYLLSEFTKKKCTIVLTGEGSDEIFAGYMQYKFMKLHQNYLKHIPKILRTQLFNATKLMPKSMLNKIFKYSESLGEKGMDRFNQYLKSNNPAKSYLELVSIFNKDEKQQLLNNPINHSFKDEFTEKYFSKNLINSFLKMEINTTLTENLLMKVDKNTMAFAIEARVPFLDHNLVEFAFTIPQNLKLHNFTDKYILRRSMKNILPKSTLKKKKERFFVPIDSWINAELRDFMKQILSQEELNKHKLFNKNYIEKINSELKRSRLFYMRQLWSLMSFQLWHKIFVEQEKIK